jgi:uncharacterized damage-inducible protein DinB
MYNEQYAPVARTVGRLLSYKAWSSCMKEGLRQTAKALPACIPSTIRVGRAAKHSKFPECSTCQRLRKEWLAATQNCQTNPERVEVTYAALLKHMASWGADRRKALNIREACFLNGSSAIYECDDK